MDRDLFVVYIYIYIFSCYISVDRDLCCYNSVDRDLFSVWTRVSAVCERVDRDLLIVYIYLVVTLVLTETYFQCGHAFLRYA